MSECCSCWHCRPCPCAIPATLNLLLANFAHVRAAICGVSASGIKFCLTHLCGVIGTTAAACAHSLATREGEGRAGRAGDDPPPFSLVREFVRLSCYTILSLIPCILVLCMLLCSSNGHTASHSPPLSWTHSAGPPNCPGPTLLRKLMTGQQKYVQIGRMHCFGVVSAQCFRHLLMFLF